MCTPGELAPESAALTADARAGGREVSVLLRGGHASRALEAAASDTASSSAASPAHLPVIAPARLLWQPVAPKASGRPAAAAAARLWLFVHPGVARQVQEQVARIAERGALQIESLDIG